MKSCAVRSSSRTPNRDALRLTTDILPATDFVCIFLAASLGHFFYGVWLAPYSLATELAGSLQQAALVAAVVAPFVLYDKRFGSVASRGQIPVLLRSHLQRFALFFGLFFALGAIGPTLDTFPRGVLVIWCATALLLTSFTRILATLYIRHLQHRGLLSEVIAIVGAGPVADRLVHALREARPRTIDLLGVFDDKIIGAKPSTIKRSGTLAQLMELGNTRQIDWIVLALPPTAEHRIASIVQRLKALSAPIGLCWQHLGLAGPGRTIDYVGGSVPLSLLACQPIKRWDTVVKAAEDYLIAGAATLLLLPLLAIIAIAIKLDSPGPIIFRQRRHALNNDEFYVYKFRTMTWNPVAAAGSIQQTSRHDARVTRVGHFLRSSSLDELPQLFNVLRGNMSLVGPRPHAVTMRTEDRLGSEITEFYAHRHRVKPGITGWAQVNGARGATDTTEQLQRRVDLDLEYIEKWSLLLDLKILALTCFVVLRRTNAY